MSFIRRKKMKHVLAYSVRFYFLSQMVGGLGEPSLSLSVPSSRE